VRPHAGPLQFLCQEPSEGVIPDPADEMGLDFGGGEPGRRVGARAAGCDPDRDEGVSPEDHLSLYLREQVVEQVPHHDDPRDTPKALHFSRPPVGESR
jgi:hypothetical protein